MENIIFIPGITGTTLVNSNTVDFDTIYSGIQIYFEKVEQSQLQLDPDYDQDDEIIVERSHVEMIAYKEIAKLFPRNEYRTYIFGYDWRKSNAVTGAKLKVYIDMLRRKLGNPNEKFHFVTHSMGALVFSAYLKQCNGDYAAIDRVVLTVPPFCGAVEALRGLVTGKWTFVNTKAQFRNVALTLPSMYELLPDYPIPAGKYADAPSFKAGVTKDEAPCNIFNPDNWQTSLYRDNKDAAQKAMIAARLAGAEAFRKSGMLRLDDPALKASGLLDRILVLVGDGSDTLTGVQVLPNDLNEVPTVHNYYDFDRGLLRRDSDGTVPAISCRAYSKDVMTLTVKARAKIFDFPLGEHANFLNYDRVQILINRFFKLPKWKPEEKIANKLAGSKWWMVPDASVGLVQGSKELF